MAETSHTIDLFIEGDLQHTLVLHNGKPGQYLLKDEELLASVREQIARLDSGEGDVCLECEIQQGCNRVVKVHEVKRTTRQGMFDSIALETGGSSNKSGHGKICV